MNGDFEMTATWGDKPLEALAKHVAERSKFLWRSWQDSAIGAMIAVIKSLRSETNKAKPAKYDESTITEIGGLRAGWTHREGRPRRCIRNMRGVRDEALERKYKIVYFCPPTSLQAKPFLVSPVHESRKMYVVVAESAEEARAYDVKIQRAYKKKWGSFAHTALGYAMCKLSTKNRVPLKSFRMTASWSQIVAAGFISAAENGEEEVYVRDSLNYAVAALKGGRASVDAAVMKTANKIYGEVQHYLNVNGLNLFSEERSMPFPDVSKVVAS